MDFFITGKTIKWSFHHYQEVIKVLFLIQKYFVQLLKNEKQKELYIGVTNKASPHTRGSGRTQRTLRS